MKVNNKITRAVKYLLGLVATVKKKYNEVQRYDSLLMGIPDSYLGTTVLIGPFKGMNYDIKDAYFSAFYPKIIGSYEFELHGIFQKMINEKEYDNIFDVGCADGYYAVGLALKMKMKHTVVYAIDINEQAIRLCTTLTEQNQLNNIKIEKAFFDNQYYQNHLQADKQHNLIVMDCEGYEKVFFDTFDPKMYSTADFLIEVHDFLSLGLAETISSKLSPTHHVEIIHSIDDIYRPLFFKKAVVEDIPFFSLTYEQQFVVMREGRVKGMVWIVAAVK